MDYKKLSKNQLIKEIEELKKLHLQEPEKDFLSSNCYYQIFNHTNDALLVYHLSEEGIHSNFIQVNKVAINLLGYSEQELKKMNFKDIIPKGFESKSLKIHKELLNLKNYDYEIIIITKSKDNIPVQISSHIFKNNKKITVITTIKDLIEKRRNELKHKKGIENSKTLLRLFLNAYNLEDKDLHNHILNTSVNLTNSTIGFLHKVADDQKTIILTAWNKETLKSCSASHDTHYPLDKAGNWVDCIHKKEPVIYNNFTKSPNQKGLPIGHTPIKRFMSIPVFDGNKIHYIFGVGNKSEDYNEHDIIQIQLIANEFVKIIKRRNADKALKESEEKFRTIFENSVVGFYRTTPGGDILLANPALVKMLGYSSLYDLKEKKIDSGFFDPKNPRSEFENKIKHEGKIIDHESIWIRKDGSRIFVSESAFIFYNKDGSINYYEGTVTNITNKKIAEEAFIESNQKYKALFEGAGDAIFIIKNNKFIDCNKKAFETFGYTKEDILKLSLYEISPQKQPDGQESKTKTIKKINKAIHGEFLVFEWLYKKKNGDTFDAEVSLARIQLKTGTFLQAIVRDITKRKNTEKALLENKSKLKEAQKLAHIGHWNLNLVNNKLEWSDEIYRIFNIEKNKFEATYESFLNYIHPEDKELVNNAYSKSVKDRTKYDIIHRIILPSKEIRFVREQCKTKYDKNGKPIYSLGTTQDITELKKTEDELNSYKNHLEEIIEKRTTEVSKLSQALEQSPVSAVITNINGEITYVNKTFCKITGYSKREAIGQNPKILKSNHHKTEFYKNLWDTILSGKIWKGEFKNKKKNGDTYWESASISPLMDKEKNITSFIAVKEDITKSKKLQEDLIAAKETAEKATKIKSEFLANMSHEIRTPMNAIIGFTDLLLMITKDKEHLSYLNSLHSSGKNLLSLINDILDFSKIEAGKLEINYKDIDTKDFFTEIKDIFALKIENRGLQFIIEISNRVPKTIEIDDLRLRQILINLINNAVKFTKKGHIKLKTSFSYVQNHKNKNSTYKYGNLTITIEDTGIGISKKYQDKIFESFTQESAKTTRKYGGSGLGLSITYKLVKLLNGNITLNSKINKGTKFAIKFPNTKVLNKKLSNRNKKEENNKVKFNPANILIIDDIENNRGFLKESLLKLNLSVNTARNGKEALLQIKKHTPDLIITDIRMPVMDGYEFFNILKEQKKNIPVIATTASIESNKNTEKKNLQFNDFLTKPILLKDLVKILAKHIPHKKQKNNLSISHASKNDLNNIPLILKKLEGEHYQEWIEFKKKKPIKNLESFGNKLLSLGKKYDNSILTYFANSLIRSIKVYDIESIENLLNNYEALIKKLKSYHE